ncbi:MAG: cysteine synthase A [Rickettsiales bacterium]|nr:cysteine synthase A [Rickettsiales bacterium]
MVKLNRITEAHGCVADVYAKLEFFNPLSSVKDRIALSMVEAAQASGKINDDTILVEPTSGNTGIALAFACAAKGIKLILTMPESMSMERRKMLKILGADLELTPAAKGMRGAIERAEQIVAENDNSYMLQQFENPANPDIHRRTTALEIWNDSDGKVDVFIAGVGTGGTITGTSQVLKEKKSSVISIAVEPEDSPVLSGGNPGPHKIQGIGAGFVPGILDTGMIDEIVTIGNETAFNIAREVAKSEGIGVGISSGATLAAAIEVAKREEMKGKFICAIVASPAERYISTDLFADI